MNAKGLSSFEDGSLEDGGPPGDRTLNLEVKSLLLCQLS